MVLPEKMLYLLPDISSSSLSAYYQLHALCMSSSWHYFLCHAQELHFFEIFAKMSGKILYTPSPQRKKLVTPLRVAYATCCHRRPLSSALPETSTPQHHWYVPQWLGRQSCHRISADNSQTVQVKNLQKLMTEIYKSIKKLNPSYLWEFHERKEITYNLRTKDLCKLPKIKKRYGSESLSFRGSLLWNTLSDKFKQSPTLAAFKNQIKSWTGDKCTCRLCI